MFDLVNIHQQPALMTVAETAKVLRKGKNYVYNEVGEGRMPHVRLGKSVRILRDRLIESMERSTGE